MFKWVKIEQKPLYVQKLKKKRDNTIYLPPSISGLRECQCEIPSSLTLQKRISSRYTILAIEIPQKNSCVIENKKMNPPKSFFPSTLCKKNKLIEKQLDIKVEISKEKQDMTTQLNNVR